MQKDKKDDAYSPVRMNVLNKDDTNLTGTVNVGDVIKLRFYLDDETGETISCHRFANSKGFVYIVNFDIFEYSSMTLFSCIIV